MTGLVFKGIAIISGVLLLAACQSLSGDDIPATLEIQMTAYATEVAVLREQSQAQRTAAVSTITFAETQAAAYFNYNNILVGTVRAGQVATPSERVIAAINQSSMSGEMMVDSMEDGAGEAPSEGVVPAGESVTVGNMAFTVPILTASVRPEDRCATGTQSTFSVSTTPIVYLVTVADNLAAGTRIEVDWRYENQRVFLGYWEASEAAAQICIAMELQSERVNFRAGNWTATLLVNGTSSGSVAFTMVE